MMNGGDRWSGFRGVRKVRVKKSWFRILTGDCASDCVCWGGGAGGWRSGSDTISRSSNLDSLLVVLIDNFMVMVYSKAWTFARIRGMDLLVVLINNFIFIVFGIAMAYGQAWIFAMIRVMKSKLGRELVFASFNDDDLQHVARRAWGSVGLGCPWEDPNVGNWMRNAVDSDPRPRNNFEEFDVNASRGRWLTMWVSIY